MLLPIHPKTTNKKKKFVLALQFTIAAAAFFYLSKLIEPEKALQIIRQADIRWYFLCLALALLNLFFSAARWSILLNALNIHYSIKSAYLAYLASAFVSIFLPGILGGDAMRAWRCAKESGLQAVSAFAITMLERVLGVISIFLILLMGILFIKPSANYTLNYLPILISIICIGSLVVAPSFIRKLSTTSATQSTRNKNKSKLSSMLNQIVQVSASIKARHVFIAIFFSILSQLADIIAVILAGYALHLPISLVSILIAVPISYLATSLPISPSGLGVREGAFVATLALFGFPADEAAMLALAVFLMRVIVGLLGGFVLGALHFANRN